MCIGVRVCMCVFAFLFSFFFFGNRGKIWTGKLVLPIISKCLQLIEIIVFLGGSYRYND